VTPERHVDFAVGLLIVATADLNWCISLLTDIDDGEVIRHTDDW